MPTINRLVTVEENDVVATYGGGGFSDLAPLRMDRGSDNGIARIAVCRLLDVTIPFNATITSAVAKLTYDRGEVGGGATENFNLLVEGWKLIDPVAPTDATEVLAAYAQRTTASVAWDVASAAPTTRYTSPSIAAAAQEIVSLPGWTSGMAMGWIVRGLNSGSSFRQQFISSIVGGSPSANAFEVEIAYTDPPPPPSNKFKVYQELA